MKAPMSLGKRILRMISPKDEAQRMELRLALDTVDAHTEDLTRTLTIDGAELRRRIAEHFNGKQDDPEATHPGPGIRVAA